jgi:bifunctional ADP-heptose synthase (sugar kinase/adenylyltransferase)
MKERHDLGDQFVVHGRLISNARSPAPSETHRASRASRAKIGPSTRRSDAVKEVQRCCEEPTVMMSSLVGKLLLERWSCEQILLTLGEQGMLVFSTGSSPAHIPAKAREVFDVSGAGDTAIAVYTFMTLTKEEVKSEFGG